MKEVQTGLLLGGPMDGRRLAIDMGRDVLRASDGSEYVRVQIAGDRAVFTLWVAKGRTPDEALGRLIFGYDPETADLYGKL